MTAVRPLPELLDLDLRLDEAHQAPSPPSRRRRPGVAAVAASVAAALAVAALAVALTGAGSGAAPTGAAVPPGVPAFAEMYLSAYLTAWGPHRSGELRRFYPAAPELEATPQDRAVTQVVTTGIEAAGPAAWRVEVAAAVLVDDGEGFVDDGIHRYRMEVVATGAGLAATGLPGRVPAPPPAPVPATAAAGAVEDEALRAVVEGFLAAYLLGSGEVAHLVTAAGGIVPVTPPPYRSLSVAQLSAVERGDGLHVRAQGTATPRRGSPLPFEQHLVVVDEGGAWRVDAVAAGPPRRAGTG